LYLKQGHQQDALRVYQALLAQRPSDARLRRRVEQLSGGGEKRRAGSGVSAQAFLKGIWSGRAPVAAAAPPPPAPEPPPAPTAAARAPAPVDQSTLEAAFDSAGGDSGPTPGEPSRPADDHISLDSVFGDDAARRSTSTPPPAQEGAGGAPGAGGGGFSFDDFFSGAASGAGSNAPPGGAGGGGGETAPTEPSGARTPGRSSGRTQRPPEDEVEADQFQQWLKKLKS